MDQGRGGGDGIHFEALLAVQLADIAAQLEANAQALIVRQDHGSVQPFQLLVTRVGKVQHAAPAHRFAVDFGNVLVGRAVVDTAQIVKWPK